VLDAVLWSPAAGVTQPIFFGGELKAAQDIRTAEQKAAGRELRGDKTNRGSPAGSLLL